MVMLITLVYYVIQDIQKLWVYCAVWLKMGVLSYWLLMSPCNIALHDSAIF